MKKLIEIQNELKAPKSQRNNFGKYNYRNAEDILESVKPLLLKHECTLFISDEIIQVSDRIYIKANCNFSDGEKNIVVSAMARESENKKGMDASQITGSSSSYARKYALNGLFLIDDTKDADFQNNNNSYSKPAPKAKITLIPTHDKWSKAIDFVKGGKTIAELKKYYNITEENSKILIEQAQEIAYKEAQEEINNK